MQQFTIMIIILYDLISLKKEEQVYRELVLLSFIYSVFSVDLSFHLVLSYNIVFYHLLFCVINDVHIYTAVSITCSHAQLCMHIS
jgi:hypothetical protein